MDLLFATCPALIFGYITATSYSNTLTLGSVILGIFVAVGTLIGIFFGVKWKTAYRVEVKAREGAESFGTTKDLESKDLHNKLLEAMQVIGDQKRVIERLEALPNLERIVHLMGEQSVRADAAASRRLAEGLAAVHEAFTEVMESHEAKAEARTDRLLDAIEGRFK